MDIELLRTFIEVNRTRHFGKAAENLFLTQAAVSARIKTLEDVTGVPLFTRARNNIQLTVAGQKLLGHAETMINTWNRARHEIAAEDEDRTPFSLGTVASLLDMMLDDWAQAIYASVPKLLLHAVVGTTDELLRSTRDATLDMALMYECPQANELDTDEFARIQLVMVSSEPGTTADEAISGRYVYVDWGTTFSISHASAFPELPTPIMRVDAGRLAKSFILHRGGSAYLAYPMVTEDIKAGRLHLVGDAPSIDRLAYAVWSRRSDRGELIQQAIGVLKNISKSMVL
jgi:DNA-binding transcriptional LysR family regulator